MYLGLLMEAYGNLFDVRDEPEDAEVQCELLNDRDIQRMRSEFAVAQMDRQMYLNSTKTRLRTLREQTDGGEQHIHRWPFIASIIQPSHPSSIVHERGKHDWVTIAREGWWDR